MIISAVLICQLRLFALDQVYIRLYIHVATCTYMYMIVHVALYTLCSNYLTCFCDLIDLLCVVFLFLCCQV